MMDSYDVVIVGAGPAGLSAALILGRCRRRVLICDGGAPRNAASHALHGFLTRDGIPPLEFLQIAREQLRPYPGLELREIEVQEVKRTASGFTVTLRNNTNVFCGRLLLATGVIDRLPEIEGLLPLYGRSVFHCPYCDGWEMRDRRLAIYGRGKNGAGLALELILWSRDLVLCTDGPGDIPPDEIGRLQQHRIKIEDTPIRRLVGLDGALQYIEFTSGEVLERDAMFFSTGNDQRCHLAKELGCQFTDEGAVATGDYEITNVPGVYVAGDASRLVQLAIVAAAEGAKAAFAINQELLKEDLA
jgi:thioredoxin reductase